MSERREPSWVDYGNLAANLIQVGQLSDVQKRLRQVAEMEAAREERVRLINELRQIVFESEEGLKQVGKHTTNAPAGVLIAVSILKTAFDEMGVVPQTFEEFIDKDRVKRVREIIQNRIDESLQRLSNEQLSEAQRMIALVPKLGDLDILISAIDAKKELTKTELEWKTLEKKRKNSLQPLNILMIISLVWCGFSYFTVNNINWMDIDQPVGLGILFVMFGIPVIGMITSLVTISKLSSKRLDELRKYRAQLQKLLLSVEKYKTLINEFGEKTNEEYKSIRSNFLEYMERVTKKDKNGNDLPESLLSITIPTSILEQAKAG